MNDILTLLQSLPGKVLGTLATGAIISAVAMISRTVRQAVLYRRVEFKLPYRSDSRGCEWDIQWEDLRFTLEVGDVHNDHLEKVTLKRQRVNPGVEFANWPVSNAFHQVPGWRLFIKVHSIVRAAPGSGLREYTVQLVVRRPRWGRLI